MQYRQITEDYAVSPQISIEDLKLIKDAGFNSVICNRPNGEDANQLTAEEIGKAAAAVGLAFRWNPVISGQMTPHNVEEQAAALHDLPSPVLAYCRSGTRSANLFAGIQQMKG
ncbi:MULTISPECIES: TIGR01244 family sulfur transferase [Mesorhizobium]|uniref:TIGR01244 family phosphatase n=1 Tax=Mesorhizobium denitrificans TaxID=2294114 RepID=A0A371XIG7_9HYPH|nr:MULTISPECIES: TIGR01244 family sulfur transferase [Mesorhizobium]RFC69028.1 TIGR01244 family phosphatase [Mesorhizobium denitrificans]